MLGALAGTAKSGRNFLPLGSRMCPSISCCCPSPRTAPPSFSSTAPSSATTHLNKYGRPTNTLPRPSHASHLTLTVLRTTETEEKTKKEGGRGVGSNQKNTKTRNAVHTREAENPSCLALVCTVP